MKKFSSDHLALQIRRHRGYQCWAWSVRFDRPDSELPISRDRARQVTHAAYYALNPDAP